MSCRLKHYVQYIGEKSLVFLVTSKTLHIVLYKCGNKRVLSSRMFQWQFISLRMYLLTKVIDSKVSVKQFLGMMEKIRLTSDSYYDIQWHNNYKMQNMVYQPFEKNDKLSQTRSITFTFMHLADAFIQSDLQLHSGYTITLVHVFPGNRTHNLLRCWRNALPLSHTEHYVM